jgi:hypothetical protein
LDIAKDGKDKQAEAAVIEEILEVFRERLIQ